MDSTKGSCLPFYKLVIRCALFTLIFSLISALCILLMSCIFYGSQNPTAKIPMLGYIGLYLSVFLTSFIMTRVNREKWLFGGLILGAMIFIVTLFLSIFIKDAPNSSSIIYRALIVLTSLCTSFLARKRSTKKAKPKTPKNLR
ncbi:MAG: TIGR04086 family membrane protein [Ruminococcaceae bacterium]|nr:TIGR04086 family membrane protein [Oscillospiraceae bacterium]